MSQLTKFKLTTVTKSKVDDPIVARRCKLIAAIDQQIKVLAAFKIGKEYQFVSRRVSTTEDGERKVADHTKTLRPWFFENDNGWYVQCRYGSRILALHGKSNAIFVDKADQIEDVLVALRASAESGEFDKAIAMTMRSATRAV